MGLIAFDQIKCILMVKLGKHRRCDSRVSLVAETFCDLRRKHRTIWNNTFLQIETNAVFQFETNTFLQIETNTCLQIKTSTFLQFETNIKKCHGSHGCPPVYCPLTFCNAMFLKARHPQLVYCRFPVTRKYNDLNLRRHPTSRCVRIKSTWLQKYNQIGGWLNAVQREWFCSLAGGATL